MFRRHNHIGSFIIKLVCLCILAPVISKAFNFITIGACSLYIFTNIYGIISFIKNQKGGIKKEELEIKKFLSPIINIARKLFYGVNLRNPIMTFIIIGLIIGYRNSGIPKSLFVFSTVLLLINLSWDIYRKHREKEIPSLRELRKEYCY
jgi:hypothetical protein